jgi:hypothetical protein
VFAEGGQVRVIYPSASRQETLRRFDRAELLFGKSWWEMNCSRYRWFHRQKQLIERPLLSPPYEQSHQHPSGESSERRLDNISSARKCVRCGSNGGGYETSDSRYARLSGPKQLQIDDLTVTLSFPNGASAVEIGTARCKEILTSGALKRPIVFSWDCTLAALIVYERLRDGKEPSFQLTVSGKLYFLLAAGPVGEPEVPSRWR